jgi:hypothetical protein
MAVKIIFWKVNKKKKTLLLRMSKFTITIGDTYLHAWEVLAEILKSDEAKDMILDIGM